MENFVEFIKEKKLILISLAIIIVILIVIIVKIKKSEADNSASPNIIDNWKINTVDESTNDPFAEQYQIEYTESNINRQVKIFSS